MGIKTNESIKIYPVHTERAVEGSLLTLNLSLGLVVSQIVNVFGSNRADYLTRRAALEWNTQCTKLVLVLGTRSY